MSPSLHGTLLLLGERRLDTIHGGFTAHLFENLVERRPLIALTRGDVSGAAPLFARVHSSCVTSEVFGGRDCDCAEQLSVALEEIARVGRGVLFYLMQEGRGAGFAAKARDRMLVQASRHGLTTFEAYEYMGLARDLRRYDGVGFACRVLGITAPLRLLTNNPEKVAALGVANVDVDEVAPLTGSASPFNLHYIDSKRRSGHALGTNGGLRAAELPEPVESFEPETDESDPAVVRLASYLLPVGFDGGEIFWLRVSVCFDVATRAERVLLSYGDAGDRAPLVAVHDESLLDRFPLRNAGPSRRRWQAIVRAIAAWGSGCVLVRSAEGASHPDEDPEKAAGLIARHLRGRRVRIIAGPDRRDALGEGFRALGIEIEGVVVLEEA